MNKVPWYSKEDLEHIDDMQYKTLFRITMNILVIFVAAWGVNNLLGQQGVIPTKITEAISSILYILTFPVIIAVIVVTIISRKIMGWKEAVKDVLKFAAILLFIPVTALAVFILFKLGVISF